MGEVLLSKPNLEVFPTPKWTPKAVWARLDCKWTISGSMLRAPDEQSYELECDDDGFKANGHHGCTAVLVVFQSSTDGIRLLKWLGVCSGLMGT